MIFHREPDLKSKGLTIRFLWFQYLVNVFLGFWGIRNFSSIFLIIVIITIVYIYFFMSRPLYGAPPTLPPPLKKSTICGSFKINTLTPCRHVKRACLAGAQWSCYFLWINIANLDLRQSFIVETPSYDSM